MDLTWPQAIALIGTVISICYTLIHIFRVYLHEKKNNPEVEDLKDRISNLEQDLSLLDKDVDHSKSNVEKFQESANKERKIDSQTIAKLEKKIEKITDLMIEIIRKNNS